MKAFVLLLALVLPSLASAQYDITVRPGPKTKADREQEKIDRAFRMLQEMDASYQARAESEARLRLMRLEEERQRLALEAQKGATTSPRTLENYCTLEWEEFVLCIVSVGMVAELKKNQDPKIQDLVRSLEEKYRSKVLANHPKPESSVKE